MQLVCLGMLSESIGCVLAILHRSRADANDVCRAAQSEIDKAVDRLRNASWLVDNAIGSYSLADPSDTR